VELARNDSKNQKAIYKAGAIQYLLNILVSKDRYGNDDLMVNALFLCWVIARVAPKGLANPEFLNSPWPIADILVSLQGTNNPTMHKIIESMEGMIRTPDALRSPPPPYS